MWRRLSQSKKTIPGPKSQLASSAAKFHRSRFRAHAYGRRAHVDRMVTNSAVDDQLRLHHLQVPRCHATIAEGAASSQWSTQPRTDIDRLGNHWIDLGLYPAPKPAQATALLKFCGSSLVAGDDDSRGCFGTWHPCVHQHRHSRRTLLSEQFSGLRTTRMGLIAFSEVG